MSAAVVTFPLKPARALFIAEYIDGYEDFNTLIDAWLAVFRLGGPPELADAIKAFADKESERIQRERA